VSILDNGLDPGLRKGLVKVRPGGEDPQDIAQGGEAEEYEVHGAILSAARDHPPTQSPCSPIFSRRSDPPGLTLLQIPPEVPPCPSPWKRISRH